MYQRSNQEALTHRRCPYFSMWFVFVLSVVCFMVWTVLVFYSPTVASIDEYCYALASKGASSHLSIWFARRLTSLGYGTFLYLLCGLLVLYLMWRRNIRAAVWLVASLVVAIRLDWALKLLFARPRPPGFAGYAILKSYSYPSGHAFNSLFFYGIALWVLRKFPNACLRSRWTAASVFILIALIGVSRLVLGVHWLSDVVGGFMAGSVWLIVNMALAERWRLLGADK